jgi:hypothetical protein
MEEAVQDPPDADLIHRQFRAGCENYCATAFGRSKSFAKLLADGRSLRRLFYKFDRNRDGVIDQREFRRMIIFELHLKMRDPDMDRLFTTYDTSRTGTINFVDFEEAFSDWLPPPPRKINDAELLRMPVVPPPRESPLWSEHPMYHKPTIMVKKDPELRPSSPTQTEPKRVMADPAHVFPRAINISRSLSSVQTAKDRQKNSNAVKLTSLKKGKDKRSFSVLLAGASVLPPAGSVPIAFTPEWLHTSTALKAQTSQWAGMYPTVCNNYYPPVLKILFAKEVLMFMNREFDLQAKLMKAWTKDDPEGGIKQLRKSTIVQLRERNPGNLKECMESLYEIVTGGPPPPPGFLLPMAHGGLWHLSALSMWRGSFPVLTGEFGKMLAEVQELQGKDYAPDTGQVQREFKALTRRTTKMSTEAYIAAMKITDCVLSNLCAKEVHVHNDMPDPLPSHMKADAQHVAWFLGLVKSLQPGIGLYSLPALHYIESVAVAALREVSDIPSASALLDKASDVRGLCESDVRGWYSLYKQIQRLCVRQVKKLMFSKLKRPKETAANMTREEMDVVWGDTTQYTYMVAAGFGVEILRPTYDEYEEKRVLNAISQELEVSVALGPKSRIEGAMQLLLNMLLLPGVARPTATEMAKAAVDAAAAQAHAAKMLEEDPYWEPEDKAEGPAPPERLLQTGRSVEGAEVSEDTARMLAQALKLLPSMNEETANVAPIWSALVLDFIAVCGEEAVTDMLRDLMDATVEAKVARSIRDAFAIVEITLPHLTPEWKPSVINKMGALLPYAHMLDALDIGKVWSRVCLQGIRSIGEKKAADLVTRFTRRSLSWHLVLWLDAEKICLEPKCRANISQDLPLPGANTTGEAKWKKCFMDNLKDALQLSKNRIEVTDLSLKTHEHYLLETVPPVDPKAEDGEEQPVPEDTRDPAVIEAERIAVQKQMLTEYVRVGFNLLPSASKKDSMSVDDALAALQKVLSPPEAGVWRGRNYKDELESQILTQAIDRSKPMLTELFDVAYVETAISFGAVTAVCVKAEDSVADATLAAMEYYGSSHKERIDEREERIEREEEKLAQQLAGTYVAEEEDSDDEEGAKEPEKPDCCDLTHQKLRLLEEEVRRERVRTKEGKKLQTAKNKRIQKRKKRQDIRARIVSKRERLTEIDGCAERGEDTTIFDREVQGIKKYLTLTPFPEPDTESDDDGDDDPCNADATPSAEQAYFYSRVEQYAGGTDDGDPKEGVAEGPKGGNEGSGNKGSIFVSFNWTSWKYARDVSEGLENLGYRVIARDSFEAMHGPTEKRIEDALKTATAVVVLATRGYLLSHDNMSELIMADVLQVPLVPVLLEDPADVSSWNYGGSLTFPVSRFGKVCERNEPVNGYKTINEYGQDSLPGHAVVQQCTQLAKAIEAAKASLASKKAHNGVMLPQSAATILNLGRGAR